MDFNVLSSIQRAPRRETASISQENGFSLNASIVLIVGMMEIGGGGGIKQRVLLQKRGLKTTGGRSKRMDVRKGFACTYCRFSARKL